ncbi:hypothetical protein [Noviherbaspirillum aerium]|uniref:hypothetical protein n=1 Tax=Noviherbaspirillum aerium TaxID=2588497 RepID=UPI00124F1907|nr:hypothetical protein [Noviherbaspirillum aerium]
MTVEEILEFIRSTETAEVDATTVAEIYAHALSAIEGNISETDMRRLLLLGAAMYRNGEKGRGVDLQMPYSSLDEQVSDFYTDLSPKGGLH